MATRAHRAYLDKHLVDRSVIDLARERVVQVFDRFDTVSVAFSGGKDSTAALNLTLNEHRDRHGVPVGQRRDLLSADTTTETDPDSWDGHRLDVIFYDEEAIPSQTEDYLRRVASIPDVSLRWMALPYRHVNACSPKHPWWTCWDPDVPERWCRPLPPEAITEWPGVPIQPPDARAQLFELAPIFYTPVSEYGTVGYVMGIRADESMTRLRAVTRRMEDNWLVPYRTDYGSNNVTKCYVVYDMRTTDVWTAPARFGWDVNEAYDLQELHGFHGSRQRIAPPFGAEPMQMLGMYATCWPELWERMVDRVPGAATAARYARTELYSFRGRPSPAQGETWKELVLRLLERHAPETQRKIRERLKDEMRWHATKTTNPILPTAPHPVTGMTWEWLSMIALRGDLKKRKNAGWELGEDTPEQRQRLAREYKEQYHEIYGAGRQGEIIG